MPLTSSAIKKLRKDRKIEEKNKNFKRLLDTTLRKAEVGKKEEQIRQAVSIIDKAVKKNIYHKNKAARLKSKLAKLILNKDKNEEKVKTVKTKNKSKTSAKKTVKIESVT